MRQITPKGRNILIGLGIVALILIVWFTWPSIQLRSERNQEKPEEFTETPETELIDFLTKLPHETDHYRVEFDDYYNRVVVVPIIDIDNAANPLTEMERVWPTYEQHANEAIAWMKAEKADFQSFDLSFWNEDFWPTGKSIAY